MRKSTLLTATALHVLLLAPHAARAATSISTDTTGPVVTSTAGDTTVTSDGSITLTSGTAITLDSDNVLDFAGDIAMSASDSNSTGILITAVPDRTQALTLGGTITVTDDFDAEDTTDDDIVDAPWAEGTGRYGLHSLGASPFTGDIDIASTIQVDGNESYGVRFENAIDGGFTYDGAMAINGDNSTGLALDGAVSGNVYLSGSISVHGENTSAVTLKGDLAGSLIIDGSYSGSGYAAAYYLDSDTLAGLDPALNLQQSGPLVAITGNVANGILLGASLSGEDDDIDDEDGDGLDDDIQSTASLTQYGGAPALLIGSDTKDLTIGGLTYADSAIDPPAVDYGLLIRGGVSASGIYAGVDTTALRIGGTDHTVTIENGIGVDGSVSAAGYGANSTAISLLAGATTPRLDVTGAVTGSTTTATTSATDDDDNTTYTTVGAGTTGIGIDIAGGASLPLITVGDNAGIYGSATGSTANATAIRDRSDTLTAITNTGKISATITASDDDGDDVADDITGAAVAIDVHANTRGLTLTQTDTAPEDTDDDNDIATPYIYGKIWLGSGNDTISSSGGYIYGAIDWGAGSGNFTLTDAAAYAGKMTSAGDIAIDIDSGASLILASGSSVRTSTLHVGGDASLGITLDADQPSSPILTGSGAATFDDGAALNLTLDAIITTPTTFKVLTASEIDLGDIVTSTRDGYIPYLYHADLETNDADTELYANFRLKTQAEAGYSSNQYAALLPVLAAVSQDSGAQTSLLGTTAKDAFDQVYNQYLPDYSGENLLTLSLGSESLNRSLGALTTIPDNNGGQYWLQEYGYSVDREYGDTAGFSSTGFSFAGGRERQVYGNQMIGAYISLTSATPKDNFAIANEIMSNSDYTLGAYWRLNTRGVKAWLHAGAGYVDIKSTRNLLTSYVSHTATAKWTGSSLSAGAGASYEYKLGGFSITPVVLADYYQLNEAKHSESGGGDYFDLSVDAREGHLLSSTAMIKAGYTKSFIRPELWLGYRQNISATLGDTVARFTGGDAFTLSSGNIEGGGPVAGFRLSADNPYSYFALEAEYSQTETYSDTSVSLRTRFQF